MRVVMKGPQRRRALRSVLVEMSATKRGGIGRMLVSRAACLAFFLTKSHQLAS